jgi:hypothetical protein
VRGGAGRGQANDAYESAREAAFENDVESLGNEDEQRRLYGLAAWLVFRAQDAAVFTVQEIAEASAVPVDRVQAFLDAACLPWGTCGEEFYGFPHATPPIQRQPVLKLDGDRYFLPLPTSLLWAVRPVVEDALKADASGDGKAWWHRYERARAGFAEAHAVSLLARAMPHAGAFHSLKYPWAKDGQQIEAELDGLVIVDDLALLVEVKSGGMSLEARRGAPNGMTEDLTALVGEPHEQALRARDYLRSADEVEFVLHDGTTLRVESGRLDDFIMVTVTLDALDVFTATLYKLTDLGVVGDGDLPWAVSLLDLAVISEVFEFPAQLIHFLRRRARLNQLAFVMAHDELDWIGHYLWEGLWFEHLVSSCEDEGAQPIVNFFGYSGEVDAHFIHAGRDGDDGPPMPRQEMPDDMRTFLRELEDAQHPGYMHVSLAVLDLGTEAREQFFQGMADAVQRTVNDGRPHNFTMVLENRQGGLTFGCDVDRDSLHSFLRSYCQLKMHQARCSEWVGIGRLVSSKFMLDEAVVLRHPWESDEELERLGTEILQPLPERDEERE